MIYNKKFHQVYEEASQELDFNQLLYRMNVISEEGHLSADEWEAASKTTLFDAKKKNYGTVIVLPIRSLTKKNAFHVFLLTNRHLPGVCFQEEVIINHISICTVKLVFSLCSVYRVLGI